MSNLPPGVTGNEYQIAGPDFEREEERTCGAGPVLVHSISDESIKSIDRMIDDLSTHRDWGVIKMRSEVNRAVMALRLLEVEEVEFNECPFEGSVIVQGYQGSLWWICPLCRTEHEEELEEVE